MKKIKFGDFVIIACVLLTAATLFCFRFFGNSDGNMLFIEYDDQRQTISLDENQEITFTTNGYTVSVTIKDGKAFVSSSDCPNHNCMDMGEISEKGESVACIPARFFMKITSEKGEAYDGIVG